MLRRLSSRLTYANVVATMALFVALGGSAYAVNTVRSTDIVDGEVASVDIKNQDIVSADVKDQSLTTFDVSTFLGADVVDGTLTAKDFTKDQRNDSLFVGDVGANTCKYVDFGLNTAVNEALLVTPEWDSASSWLSYTPEYHSTNGGLSIKVCNPTTVTISDDNTRFRILVIDSDD